MISIILPVYNVEKYVNKCLESIVAQTYSDFEVIVIDDGSTDKSGKICDDWAARDSRICVYHEVNSGVSSARNKGLKIAKGEWILFIDSDDWIDSRMLEICMREMISSNAEICFFGNKEVREENVNLVIEYERCNIKKITEEQFLDFQYRIFNRDRKACCNRNIIKLSSPCKLYKKELLDKNNITFQEQLVTGEDGVFNLYAYQYAKSGVCIEEPLYYYRIHKESVTQRFTPNIEKNFTVLHKAYERFINSTDNVNKFKEVFEERMIWSFSFCCILKYCHQDNPANYRRRKQEFLTEYDRNYKENIKNVSLKNFRLKKKIIFYFIKRKSYFMVSVLCKLQQRL